MKVVQVNTTAFEEEDFFLLTTLHDDQLAEVISPIVNAERDGYDQYDSSDIVKALQDRFPLEYVEMVEIGYFSL